MARRRYQKGCIFRRGANWVLRYRADTFDPKSGTASRTHRSVVLGPVATKKEARCLADAHLQSLNLGRQRPQAVITLDEFWNDYFSRMVLPNLKYATQALYTCLFRAHLCPAFGKCRLSEITRAQVQLFISEKQRRGYSPQTLRHFRNVLSRILGTAVKWGWLPTNEAQGVDLPQMERRRIARPLQPHEITKLSSTLREPARTVFVLGLLTGLRIGELLALRVEDLDLTNARLHVRLNVYCGHIGTPKTKGSSRTIPLAVPLLADLHRYLQDTRISVGWLFPSAAGTPLRERNLLRRQVWPACDRLGIPRFGWHSLRHTFSTLGGSNGVPMPTLQSLLGHSSLETTMLYTHPLEAAQREAVNRVATILFPSVPIFTPDTAGGKDLIN